MLIDNIGLPANIFNNAGFALTGSVTFSILRDTGGTYRADIPWPHLCRLGPQSRMSATGPTPDIAAASQRD